MAAESFDQAVRELLAVAPARAHDLARLRALMLRPDERPVVTVVGKYNHGKSRLLNELMGSDVFSVADRRETVALSEHVRQEIRWLDAPGLDADVALGDDTHAHQATWLQADIRLFVHAAREGELDALERNLLQSLYADQQRTRRQTLFVLNQVDQLSDNAQLDRVTQAIRAQAPDFISYPVSSTRHRSGVEGRKSLLLEKSGIPALRAVLQDAMAEVHQAREYETDLLLTEIRAELQGVAATRVQRRQELKELQQRQRQMFEQGLTEVLDKIQVDLQPVLEVSDTDQALVPDSFENMFKLTVGKRERATIQIAYSRACIALNSHLVRHGVTGLPLAQQTSVRSLDTVMVAVMGVSVKYRDDLRKIFCEPAGRDRLLREFSRYFELSEGRQALVSQLHEIETAVAEVDNALCAMVRLENV